MMEAERKPEGDDEPDVEQQGRGEPVTPNVTARPAASVTAKAASTSQPQASPPMPNPSAVSPAPISAKTAMRDARCP
jgi:hypothetical protein